MLDPRHIDSMAARHHGLDDDVEGGAHHFVADINGAALGCQKPVPGGFRRCDHGGLQFDEPIMAKCAGDCLSLPFPVRPIGGEKPFAEGRTQRPAHILALAQRIRIANESFVNKDGIGEIDVGLAGALGENHAFREHLRGQGLQRIS